MVNDLTTERKDKTSVVMIVLRLGWVESWIIQLKTFIYGQCFKKWAIYLLKAFIDIKINCLGIFSVQRFFGENFQERFGFWLVTVPFSLLQAHLRLWHIACELSSKRKTNLRSHNLKIDRQMIKTSKHKREGNFTHVKKNS